MNNLIFIDEFNEVIKNYDKYSENNLNLNEKNVVKKIIDIFYTPKDKEKILNNQLEIKFSKSNNFKEFKDILVKIENLFGELLISISLYNTTLFVYNHYSSKIIKEIEEYDESKTIKEKIYSGDITAICFPYRKEIKNKESIYQDFRNQLKKLDDHSTLNHFYTTLIHWDSSCIGFAFEKLFMENLIFLKFFNYEAFGLYSKFCKADIIDKEKNRVKLNYNKILYQDENFIIKMDKD